MRTYGTVPALSLVVKIEDIHGPDLYINWGGIQLLQKISGSDFVPVPRNELLTSEERNKAAVDIALKPLIERLISPGTAKRKKEERLEK